MISSSGALVVQSNSRPILIIGLPRSGTTLLATMLNAHPNIFLANEAKVFVRILPGMRCPLSEQAAEKIIARLEGEELRYLSPLPVAREILTRAHRCEPVPFLTALFELLAEREGKRRWGEKTAVAYRQLPLIRASFPDAVFLCLDRDPYEIAASYLYVIPKWGAFGAIVHWLDFKRAVALQRPEINILTVSYNRLVSDPESVLREVCDHIGEDFNPAMLNYHQTQRARALAASHTFGGPAKPLYRTAEPPAHLRSGFRGLILKKLIKMAPLVDRKPNHRSPVFLFVKILAYVRAGAWELSQRLRRR